MGSVIHVQFGEDRQWQQAAEQIRAGLLEIGDLFGDDTELLKLKADRMTSVVRSLCTDSVPVSHAHALPDGLSPAQMESVRSALEAACRAGFESAVTHAWQLMLSATNDLCTSALRHRRRT